MIHYEKMSKIDEENKENKKKHPFTNKGFGLKTT